MALNSHRIVSKIYCGGGVQSYHRSAGGVIREMRRISRSVRAQGNGAYHDCRIEGWDGEEWRPMDWDGQNPETLRFVA